MSVGGEGPSRPPRGWLLGLMAVLGVVLTAALGAATNVGTGLPFPATWTWVRSSVVIWALVVLLVVALATLAWVQHRLTPDSDQPVPVAPEAAWTIPTRADVFVGRSDDLALSSFCIGRWWWRRGQRIAWVRWYWQVHSGGAMGAWTTRQRCRRLRPRRARTACHSGAKCGVARNSRSLGGSGLVMQRAGTAGPPVPVHARRCGRGSLPRQIS